MTLVGRMTGVDGERLTFADDLTQNLELADRFFDDRFRSTIDTYIERAAIEAPPLRPADPRCRSVDDEHLSGSGLDHVVDTLGPAPVRDEHEQRAPVGTPEHGRKA
jgi:hypothetical protein